MKKDFFHNQSISINLKTMQERIDNSKFEDVNLVDILKEYFGEEILTKKENKKSEQQDLEEFLNYCLKQNEGLFIYQYMKECFEQKDKLYLYIKNGYKKEKDVFAKEFLNACNGINNLPKVIFEQEENRLHKSEPQIIRIPVFANKVLSNPHGFDKNTLCGRLFILLLCYINNLQYPKNSEELAELYYQNYLLVDDVSSIVLCKNIVGIKKAIKYDEIGNKLIVFSEHEGLRGFAVYNEPVFLTLYNLSQLEEVKCSIYKSVLIVENPAVFMEIMEKCKFKDFPLVCTYGQVKLAGIMLMDLLKRQGYKMYYSGDIDPEGIQIADKLKQRYGENIKLLGFDKKTYFNNVSNVEINETRLKKLDNIKSKELESICQYLKLNKKASYEEANIEDIIEMIEKCDF